MSNNSQRKVVRLRDLNPEEYPDDSNYKRKKKVSRGHGVPDTDKRKRYLPIQTQAQ